MKLISQFNCVINYPKRKAIYSIYAMPSGEMDLPLLIEDNLYTECGRTHGHNQQLLK